MTPDEILAEINKKLASEGTSPLVEMDILGALVVLQIFGKVRQEENRFYEI